MLALPTCPCAFYPPETQHWLNDAQMRSCSSESGLVFVTHTMWRMCSFVKPHLCSICWAWRVALFTRCAFTNAHCSHLWALQKACRGLHTTLAPSCVSHAGCNLSHNHLKEQKHILAASIMSCVKRLLPPPPPPPPRRCVYAPAECTVCVPYMRVCFQASGWVINERGWMASAGHDSTTERKSFLFFFFPSVNLLIQSSKEFFFFFFLQPIAEIAS